MLLTGGTPIWSTGFGSVTWMTDKAVGVAFLAEGEPKVRGAVALETAHLWAARWLSVMAEDGRIQDLSQGPVGLIPVDKG